MSFTGPLACPHCKFEVVVKDRSKWRLPEGEGVYKCPNCGHEFLGRNFIDIGALDRAGYSLLRERRDLMAQLETLLEAGEYDKVERLIEERFAMNDTLKESLINSLDTIYVRGSGDWIKFESEIRAYPNVDGVAGFVEEIARDTESVRLNWPRVWQYFVEKRVVFLCVLKSSFLYSQREA